MPRYKGHWRVGCRTCQRAVIRDPEDLGDLVASLVEVEAEVRLAAVHFAGDAAGGGGDGGLLSHWSILLGWLSLP